jgi:hypothetical protein
VAEARAIFSTVAHELSHQWFGNLVTMALWDDFWLNEGFASWMELKATERFHPEWEPGLSEGAPDREGGMAEDGKASTHPIVQPIASVAQAELAFDMITYKKGRALVQTLEGHLGAEVFRHGVQAYLGRNACGIAASRDLWATLDRSPGESISRIAEPYTRTAGVPLVEVLASKRAGGASLVTLRRSRHVEGGRRPKGPLPVVVPLQLRSLDAGQPVRALLQDGKAHTFRVAGHGPVLVNAGQDTYAGSAMPRPSWAGSAPGSATCRRRTSLASSTTPGPSSDPEGALPKSSWPSSRPCPPGPTPSSGSGPSRSWARSTSFIPGSGGSSEPTPYVFCNPWRRASAGTRSRGRARTWRNCGGPS